MEEEIKEESLPEEQTEAKEELDIEELAKIILEKTGGDAEAAMQIAQKLLDDGEIAEDEFQALAEILGKAADDAERQQAEELFDMKFVD